MPPPKCIIKSYQEISRPTTEVEAKTRRNLAGPAIPRNRRRSNKQLFPTPTRSLATARWWSSPFPRSRGRFSRSLSSTLDWTERLLFQAKERPRAKCFPGRLARRLAA